VEKIRTRSNRNPNRPIRTTGAQIVWVSLALFNLAVGILGGVLFVKTLISGQSYSVGVVFGDNSAVSKTDAPNGYWTIMLFYGIDFLVLPIVGIGLLREAVEEHRRKVAMKRKLKGTTPDPN
jgi:hypothetical protein